MKNLAFSLNDVTCVSRVEETYSVESVRFILCSHFLFFSFSDKTKGKGKAVPLHAMEALGGRGGIAPTHSRPRY
jgi:hypothetical protein